MTDTSVKAAGAVPVEASIRQELAHGDAMIGTVAPILRHLLANDERSIFCDEVIAGIRGMMTDVARQLLDAVSDAAGVPDQRDHDPAQIAELAEGFAGHSGFLAHVHALALETRLAGQLNTRLAMDPVLSPLLQTLIASGEPQIAESAMALMAAQARFVQSQRRMQLPLAELPGDLLHAALLGLQGHGTDAAEGRSPVAIAVAAIRTSFDESHSRLGLISRLLTGMGDGALAALSVSSAGVAIFLSALALASGQEREMAILATHEGQVVRLALALRAAGLRPESIEEQFIALHPGANLPDGFEQLGPDCAAALLARSAAFPGG